MGGELGNLVEVVGSSDGDEVKLVTGTVGCTAEWTAVAKCENWDDVGRPPGLDDIIVPGVL